MFISSVVSLYWIFLSASSNVLNLNHDLWHFWDLKFIYKNLKSGRESEFRRNMATSKVNKENGLAVIL